jgi:hypothetical protein
MAKKADLGSGLPFSKESEQAILGDVLIDPLCFSSLRSVLSAGDFFINQHGWIWQAFSNLVDRQEAIDPLTVCNELHRLGQLEEIGGESFITALLNATPTSLNSESHARQVKADSIRRRSVEWASEIATKANDPLITPDRLLQRFAEIAQEATGTAPQNYQVRTVAYALEPRPPRNYLVENLIHEKSITVLYGDGGVKKTWSSLFLGACVGSGQAWGEFATQKARVLFIDEENGESEMAIRVAMCCRGALAVPVESVDLRYISLAAFHLDDPQSEAILTNEILAQGAGLVIFDALADLMNGDENTKQDTQPVFNALRRIAEKTGAAILVIHHANKTGGFRGTSVIKDAPDILIQAESDPDSPFINFKTEKNRNGKPARWTMYANWSPDSFYLSATDPKEKPMGKGEEFVLQFLTEHGESEKDAICGSAKHCAPSTARDAIYSLLDKGKIFRSNPDENDKVKAIYALSPDE